MAGTDFGKPGIYNSSAITLSTGEGSALATNASGQALVSLSTLIAGEDLTNDVQKVEQRYSYHYIAAATVNSVVKASAGFLHAIICGAWVTNGTVEVSDHASDGDGAVKIMITMAATNIDGFPKSFIVDASFTTGITVDTIGATQVTLVYR